MDEDKLANMIKNLLAEKLGEINSNSTNSFKMEDFEKMRSVNFDGNSKISLGNGNGTKTGLSENGSDEELNKKFKLQHKMSNLYSFILKYYIPHNINDHEKSVLCRTYMELLQENYKNFVSMYKSTIDDQFYEGLIYATLPMPPCVNVMTEDCLKIIKNCISNSNMVVELKFCFEN
jgi:hypothetical protein